MRISNPVQGSRVLPYTGKPRTDAEKRERLPNGHYLFRVTQTAQQHAARGGPWALDIGNFEKGDPVLAMFDGIYRRRTDREGGNMVVGEHSEGAVTRTVFAHLSDWNIPNVATKLRAGAVIGFVGSTGTMAYGAHLHIETWQGTRAVDPWQYINRTEMPTFVDVPSTHRFFEEIEWCRENGILYGVGDKFYPDNPATRGQLAAALFRLGRKE